jgi:hypothetical protein
VNNVAPTVLVGSNGSSGVNFSRTGSFTDPGVLDTFTATVDYGDGTAVQALALNADMTFGLSHNYVFNGTYPVKVTVVDKDGGSNSATANIAITGGQTSTVTKYLSDLTPTIATNGYGSYEKDRSNGENGSADGKTITIGGVTYAKGLGVHAASTLEYSLTGGNYTTFSTDYGMDDEVNGQGSAHFQVWLDGVMVFDSGTVRGGAAKSYTVNVAGKSKLRLVVTDNGDGIANDHADWANAKLS